MNASRCIQAASQVIASDLIANLDLVVRTNSNSSYIARSLEGLTRNSKHQFTRARDAPQLIVLDSLQRHLISYVHDQRIEIAEANFPGPWRSSHSDRNDTVASGSV